MAFKIIQSVWMSLILLILWNMSSELHFALHNIRFDVKEITRDVRYIEEGNAEFHKNIFQPLNPGR